MKIMLQVVLAVLFFPILVSAQKEQSYPKINYEKQEFEVKMRDGKTLFTQVYSPKDKSRKYPIMLQRTCYSVAPYGVDSFKTSLGPSKYLMEDGYIFVYQDVRGRYMSEGVWTNMTPNITGNKHKKTTDESSDTYDTVDWLLKNIKGHNGKVGQWGISYPGFYTASALPDAHPALVASSPQAPIGDFYFDDFNHNGATTQSYLMAYPVFGVDKPGKVKEGWYRDQFIDEEVADAYQWHLDLGPLKNVEKYYKDNFFWQEVVEHPDYDEFWQKRGLIKHLDGVEHNVLTVGGFFDAEDLYGPLNIYKKVEESSPNANNMIVMGPWSHGNWARETGFQAVNHIYFGDSISTFYQKEIEFEFFTAVLKEDRKPNLPEASIFDTGKKEWRKFDAWPPKETVKTSLVFGVKEKLTVDGNEDASKVFSYISDPMKPVPYRSEIEGLTFTPRPYMSDDQRHASKRNDVLTFSTETLNEDVTLAGEIMAKLDVMISSTDADFIVKLIDVHPSNHPEYKHNAKNIKMGDYQMLVRAEVMRGRYRNGFDKPEPFIPNEAANVNFQLQDILHTFKKGHKIMIQIHSTWFPYIDRNPQKYIANIIKDATEEDYQKATITITGASKIEVNRLK
ncbi:MAG: CocE/NonD family hydrolase [Vicingaceae bacterium]|nr:CocE/NonD family hydrolase [Vicingaceae bacterium]